MGEKLAASLDGARWVQYDADGLVWAWFGGHGVHGYNMAGVEIEFYNVGDFAQNDATLDEVRESIGARILNQS